MPFIPRADYSMDNFKHQMRLIASRLFRQPMLTALILLLVCVALYQAYIANVRIPTTKGFDITHLPKEYAKSGTQSHVCEDRFGSNYLHAFQSHSAPYCTQDSPSQLTCFSNNIDQNHARTDSFCIGGPASFVSSQKKISLQCSARDASLQEANSAYIPLSRFPSYWYETGPRYVFDHYVDLSPDSNKDSPPLDARAATAILVKREDVRNNMWHGLMEIMSTYFTLDILRMTINPTTGAHYFSSSDFDNTQVIILDELEDGPYFDLWHLFARKPIIRFSSLTDTTALTTFKNVITPLPGGSNPFWQGDWTLLNCSNSTLLRVFSSRILYACKIETSSARLPTTSPEPKSDPIQLTFINRSSKRRLIQAEEYLSLLRLKFPPSVLIINIIDYAAHPFPAQLSITHESTDILLGVHGAGLTHTMFLKPGSAVIEIMPFNQVDHVGFQNLAQMMEDVGYYRGVSADRKDITKATGNWQDDDMWIDEKEFLSLVETVVHEMGRRRGLI